MEMGFGELFLFYAAIALGGLILLYLIIFKILGLRVINSNEVAVIEKWWSNLSSLIPFYLDVLTNINLLPKMRTIEKKCSNNVFSFMIRQAYMYL